MPESPLRSPIRRHRAAPAGMWVTYDGARHRITHRITGFGHAPTVATACALSIPLAIAPDPSAAPCERCR